MRPKVCLLNGHASGSFGIDSEQVRAGHRSRLKFQLMIGYRRNRINSYLIRRQG